MSLYKLRDFDPDYRESFEGQDVLGYDLYSGNEKVGSVDDLLVDEDGKFRYFIINTGIWVFGKKVLLPIGRSRISYTDRRVYADALSREQVEHLPEYTDDLTMDYQQEEQVRNIYRPTTGRSATEMPVAGTGMLNTPVPLDAASASLDRDTTAPVYDDRAALAPDHANAAYDRDTYTYDRDPDLYGMNDRDHQNLKLYEERLITNKDRRKTGEVAVGKRIETETARASIPLDKERLVIERNAPTGGDAVAPGTSAFNEGEVARVELYEETADIRKEAFVREEVTVRKEIDHDTVEAEETLRREQLDINTDGTPRVDAPDRISSERA